MSVYCWASIAEDGQPVKQHYFDLERPHIL